MLTFRVIFDGSDRVERVRAEAGQSVPPYVGFVVTGGGGWTPATGWVVATFDGRELARIATTG